MSNLLNEAGYGGNLARSIGPAAPSKSLAVTFLGLLTLLAGGAAAVFGGCQIFVMLTSTSGVTAVFALLFGVPALLLGGFGLLAALGLLLRKPWGRILTFLLAGLTLLWGPLCLVAVLTDGAGNLEAADVAAAAAPMLYGVLALVILLRNGAEFSRPGA
jgi:hypothetical protein